MLSKFLLNTNIISRCLFSRLLHTTKHYYQEHEALSCGEKAGLIIGVNSWDSDATGTSAVLTPSGERFDKRYGGKIKEMIRITKPCPHLGEAKVFYGMHKKFIGIAIVGLGEFCSGYNPRECLDERKEAIRTAVGAGVRALESIDVPKIYVDSFEHAESAAEGACLASWIYQELRDVRKRKFIKRLELFDSCDYTGWKIGLHKGAAQNLARLLQETPGNNLTPCIFAQTSIEMLAKYGISVNVRMKNWAQLRNLNGFLAVGRASCEPPVFLEILYEGCEPHVCPIVVIGKGITYNGGGLCMRSRHGMTVGRGDLIGAASVIALFRAVAALRLPINVLGLVPLCSNVIGANAYKPGDVYKCYNGKTILVEDTNCEGLLLHADILSFAREYNPKFILDIGTLSPDVIGAMGSSASAVFSNNESLYELMHVAGIHTGDRMWRFPLWKYFKNYVKAETADFSNKVPKLIGGGHCKAASFLYDFVPPGVDWIHVDVYNVYNSDGSDYTYLREGMAGRPTRTLIEFLAQLSCRGNG